jgi:hypothetical protein
MLSFREGLVLFNVAEREGVPRDEPDGSVRVRVGVGRSLAGGGMLLPRAGSARAGGALGLGGELDLVIFRPSVLCVRLRMADASRISRMPRVRSASSPENVPRHLMSQP